ncbi:hypothetical protein ABRZ24_15850 [Brenneria populi]|uniref:Uncharacterized protein n=1 Tax=Brenneria populi TaxID=1505588 RepID=A0ABU6JU71_9GAMM|nr:hypothetical protein [Brenneria populi Li et al. 2015]
MTTSQMSARLIFSLSAAPLTLLMALSALVHLLLALVIAFALSIHD